MEGALVAGLVAGLAVAVPLGAIGVLILQEGLHRGWAAASAAATGVALVDLGYAAAATLAGTRVTTALQGHLRAIQVTGALVLLAVAGHGLLRLRGGPGRIPDAGPGDVPGGRVSPPRVLVRFVALTAINPLTAIYFVVLAAGLGPVVAGPRAGSAFVLGVFGGSLGWQLVLAAVGTLAGVRLPGWARTGSTLVGYLLVLGYAVRLGFAG